MAEVHHKLPSQNAQSSDSTILKHVATYISFVICISFLPSLILCYITVQMLRKLWLSLLSNRYPYFRFVKTTSIRTLLDNHRNQGIVNVLMTIKGTCQPILIHQILMERLIDKVDRRGKLLFPKLRAGLYSCWGNYAWKFNDSFNLENHFIVGKPMIRGRPLTDHNLHEYVNEFVTKYLPSNMPPWQVIVIPNIVSNEEKYCILIRVHHLLIADDEPLNIGDFLLLKPNNDDQIPMDCARQLIKDSSAIDPPVISSLTNIIEPPKAIPKLYNMICDSISNHWNEFIYQYDPIESPKPAKSRLGFFHCSAIVMIVIVSIYKEINKSQFLNKNESANPIRYFWNTFHKEMSRRGITIMVLLKSNWVSFNPIQICINTFRSIWWIFSSFFINIPMLFYREAITLLTLSQFNIYQSTFVSFFINYLPLLYDAGKEVLNMMYLIYTGPAKLLYFFFWGNTHDKHYLQSVSLCGRKSVAWSHPVSRKAIAETASSIGVSETAILLTITSNCIKEYFCHAGLKVPKAVLITAKTLSLDTLLTSMEQNGNCDNATNDGILCFPLQLGKGDHRLLTHEALDIDKTIINVKDEQKALFSLTKKHAFIVKVLPSIVGRILLNYWARRFSVAVTEISDSSEGNYVDTQWGDRVLSLLLWTPPQGNISIAVTLQRYADTVRIGIITDSQLMPHCMAITRHWNKAARRLINNSHPINN